MFSYVHDTLHHLLKSMMFVFDFGHSTLLKPLFSCGTVRVTDASDSRKRLTLSSHGHTRTRCASVIDCTASYCTTWLWGDSAHTGILWELTTRHHPWRYMLSR